MRRLDLIDLQLFVNIVDAGSVTGGAARSHLSLAAASERLSSMESALDVALLERGRDGLRVLPAGYALLSRARSVIAHMAELRDALAAYAKGQKGRVRVLSNTSGMSDVLPEVLPRFLAANPGIELDVHECPSEDIAREVASGRSDMGVLSDKVDLSGLQAFPLRADPLALLVPRGDVLAHRPVSTLEEAAERDFVGLTVGVAFQQYIERCAAEAGRPLKIRLRAQSFESLCRLVQQRVGVGIVPLMTATRWAEAMELRIIRLNDSWTFRTLALCIRNIDTLSQPARRLFEHFTQNFHATTTASAVDTQSGHEVGLSPYRLC